MEVMNMMVVSIVPTHALWVGILSTWLTVISQQALTWALLMQNKQKVEFIWRTWSKSLKVFFCFLKKKGYSSLYCIFYALGKCILIDISWGFVIPGLKVLIILQVVLICFAVIFRIFRRRAKSKIRRYRWRSPPNICSWQLYSGNKMQFFIFKVSIIYWILISTPSSFRFRPFNRDWLISLWFFGIYVWL